MLHVRTQWPLTVPIHKGSVRRSTYKQVHAALVSAITLRHVSSKVIQQATPHCTRSRALLRQAQHNRSFTSPAACTSAPKRAHSISATICICTYRHQAVLGWMSKHEALDVIRGAVQASQSLLHRSSEVHGAVCRLCVRVCVRVRVCVCVCCVRVRVCTGYIFAHTSDEVQRQKHACSSPTHLLAQLLHLLIDAHEFAKQVQRVILGDGAINCK